jgi:signal transduction histidine kinase
LKGEQAVVQWTPQNARTIKDSLGNEFRRMPFIESELATLQIPRIAVLATSPWPAWLWSTDATRILWANAVGAAIFGAANRAELGNARFAASDPSTAQILRLSATLPSAGQQDRLARLRGFGAGFGGALMCACSRISLLDGTSAILVVATGRAGPSLPLAERVRRLFADGVDAVAAFAPDGTRLHANAAALQRLNGTTSLSALGVDALVARALRDGHANGVAYMGQIPFEVTALRLGKDESRVLALTWPTPPKTAAASTPIETNSEPIHAAPAPEVDAPAPPVAAATPAPSEPPAAEPEAPHDAPINEAAAPTAIEPPPALDEAAAEDGPVTVTELAVADLQSFREAKDEDKEPIAAEAADAPEPPPVHQGVSDDILIAERRHPLRFVWHMDSDSRFVVGSDEFMELVGPRTIAACGRFWREIATEMNLDPEGQVARAIATQETWSGVQIFWPIDDSNDRLPIELSGLPVFDRDHGFGGYRGFGVCRDVARINQLARARRARPIGFMPAPKARRPETVAPAPKNVAATPAPVATPQAAPAAAAEKAQPAAEPAVQSERPAPAAAVAAANVVPFRAATAPDAKAPSLSAIERSAFHELAQELTTRLGGTQEGVAEVAAADGVAEELRAEEQETAATSAAPAAPAAEITAANKTPALVAADLPPVDAAAAQDNVAPPPQRPPLGEHGVLDRVPAGILVYRNDAPLYANRRFLEWIGYDSFEALTAAGGLNALFAEPNADALTDGGGTQKLSVMTRQGEKLPLEGRLFTVPWDGAPALALVVTNAQSEERQRKTQLALSAAEDAINTLESEIRDLRLTFERTGKREAQNAAAAKADFLAKVSHEIRTPLNSMIGFAEVIMAERFGTIGNERYREYLKDIQTAGGHIVSLLNDLLDLSKIETGQLDLTFANVDLNDVTQQCVAIAQQQANRARIIIRNALAPNPLHVMADARSLRQIVLTLLSNAIKFTGPGGQVIVSTAVNDSGEAVLRVRDNGVGMREQDVDAILYPFHQTTAASPSWSSSGTGLGLPLTKALAEANRANFTIKSAPNSGTLVEITFPSARMAAQ